MMLVIGVVAFAPVAALTWRVDGCRVPYIAASSVLELVYFALLAAAYRRSEVSLVYPVARGLAPVRCSSSPSRPGARRRPDRCSA